MTSRSIVTAILLLFVAALIVRTRVTRGRHLLGLHATRNPVRWVLNAVFLVVAASGTVAALLGGKGPWDVLSNVSLFGFWLTDAGFDLYGRPEPGRCAFYANGILMFDGRRPVFVKWEAVGRHEWQGDTLTLYLAPSGLAHVPEIRAFDVPGELRGDVMAIVAPRLHG
jgi:hypothetical protein